MTLSLAILVIGHPLSVTFESFKDDSPLQPPFFGRMIYSSFVTICFRAAALQTVPPIKKAPHVV